MIGFNAIKVVSQLGRDNVILMGSSKELKAVTDNLVEVEGFDLVFAAPGKA